MAKNEQIRLINNEAQKLWMEMMKLRESFQVIQKRLLPADGLYGQALTKSSGLDFEFVWQTVGGGGGALNIDGGRADSLYTSDLVLNGGGA